MASAPTTKYTDTRQKNVDFHHHNPEHKQIMHKQTIAAAVIAENDPVQLPVLTTTATIITTIVLATELEEAQADVAMAEEDVKPLTPAGKIAHFL